MTNNLEIHKNIEERLDYFITNRKIPNILFHGPNGSGKRTIVYNFIDKIYNNNKEFIEKNDWILDKLIITLDKDGCMYNGNVYPTERVEIMDISGAGDTFVAGFTKKYLETKDVEQSIKFGNECSLKVVQQKGVSIVK